MVASKQDLGQSRQNQKGQIDPAAQAMRDAFQQMEKEGIIHRVGPDLYRGGPKPSWWESIFPTKQSLVRAALLVAAGFLILAVTVLLL